MRRAASTPPSLVAAEARRTPEREAKNEGGRVWEEETED